MTRVPSLAGGVGGGRWHRLGRGFSLCGLLLALSACDDGSASADATDAADAAPYAFDAALDDAGAPDATPLFDNRPARAPIDCNGFDPELPLVAPGPQICDPNAAPGRVTLYDNPAAINAFRTCDDGAGVDLPPYVGFSIPAELAEAVEATGGDRLAVRVEDLAADVDVLVRATVGDASLACERRSLVTAVLVSGEPNVLGWIYPRHSAQLGLYAQYSLVFIDPAGVLHSVTGRARAL